MWLYAIVPKRWVQVLVILLMLVLLALVGVVLFTMGPAALESWQTMDDRGRDGAIMLVLLAMWVTRPKCQCKGGCSK